MSEFDAFAPYYDLEFEAFLDDLPVYKGFATGVGGRILELACGTGRLLAPLAAAGHQLTGVDISPAMLARARTRLADSGLLGNVTLVEDDMRTLQQLGDASFRLAYCAINSFLHLTDQATQLAALLAVRQRLDAGGRLVLDVFHPHPDVLAGYDGRLVLEQTFIDQATGGRVDKFVARTLDPATQTIDTTFVYDRIDTAGRLYRQVAPFALRYIHRYELELLLDAAGFYLEDLLGDYALNPFGADSPQLIAVARPVR